jgi:hypothetical protein
MSGFGRLRTFCSSEVIVKPMIVTGRDVSYPCRLCHVRQVVLVKVRFFSGMWGVCVLNEALVDSIEYQGTPGYNKQLVTHVREGTEPQHRLTYPAGEDVRHDFTDAADLCTLKIINLIFQRGLFLARTFRLTKPVPSEIPARFGEMNE